MPVEGEPVSVAGPIHKIELAGGKRRFEKTLVAGGVRALDEELHHILCPSAVPPQQPGRRTTLAAEFTES